METIDPRDRAILAIDDFSRLFGQGRASALIDLTQRVYEKVLETRNERLIGWAIANLGTAFALCGRGEEAAPVLVDLLSQSDNPYVCYRLAQTLAGHYRILSQPDMVNHEVYSVRAYNYAERSGFLRARALARLEVGIACLTADDYGAARELFSDSVRLLRNEPDHRSATQLASLGFCLCQSGEMLEGIRALCHSIGVARAAEAPHYELYPRVYLANSMLEMRRPRDAEFHLRVALRLDRLVSSGQPEAPKILHLLGDALKMQRRSREAFDVFQHLQTNFYPDQEGLAEILMEVEARQRIDVF